MKRPDCCLGLQVLFPCPVLALAGARAWSMGPLSGLSLCSWSWAALGFLGGDGPVFIAYTDALSLKYVRAPGPPGGPRGEQLLFCSPGCVPLCGVRPVFRSDSLRRVSFLELRASRPRAPSQEPADRVQSKWSRLDQGRRPK